MPECLQQMCAEQEVGAVVFRELCEYESACFALKCMPCAWNMQLTDKMCMAAALQPSTSAASAESHKAADVKAVKATQHQQHELDARKQARKAQVDPTKHACTVLEGPCGSSTGLRKTHTCRAVMIPLPCPRRIALQEVAL